MMEKKRIEYIDLMKGICIILVVLYHIEAFKNIPFFERSLQTFRMPLYFFLSGIFFKTYGGVKNLLIKKTNNLIFPYLFFSLFILVDHLFRTDKEMFYSWGYYVFFFIEPYNIPLWFLRCLFFVYIIYYFMNEFIRDIKLRVFTCFIVAILLWYISPILKANCNETLYWILYRMNIISAFMALPYISMAEWLRFNDFFNKKFSFYANLKFLVLSIIVWLVFYPYGSGEFRLGLFEGNVICFLVASFAGLFMILFFSRIFNKIFYISYLGRYSIIVLGIHGVLLYPLHSFSLLNKVLIMMIAMPICVYFFKRYFPYFTAQKQIIYLKNNKICFFEK